MVPTLGVRSTELCMGLLNPLHRTPDTNVNIASQLYLNSNNKKKSYNLLYKFNMHAFVSTLLLISSITPVTCSFHFLIASEFYALIM